MKKKDKQKVESFKNTNQKKKRGFWFYFSNVLIYSVIGALFLIGGLEFADKQSGYKVLPNHTAVIVSDSMQTATIGNLKYLTEDTYRIKKGDIVRTKKYKSFDEVKYLDVVLYLDETDGLICHRVIDKYEADGKKFVVTRGDANNVDDTPVNFEYIRGKVTKTIGGIGNVILFAQSPYFIIGLCGAGFSVFAGILIATLFGEKKKKPATSTDVEKNEVPATPTVSVAAVKPKVSSAKRAPKSPVAKPKASVPAAANRPAIKKATTKENAQPQPKVIKNKKTGRFVSAKKVNGLIVPLLVLGGSGLAILSIDKASSMFKGEANELSFAISLGSVAKTYSIQTYLNGNVSNDYPMQINENASSEPNKIAEYYVSGVSLNKGEVLKAHSSADEYFGTFAHKWSSSISTDDDGNYVVPMTNEYNFFLKLYNNNNIYTSQLYIESTVSTVYFTPSANWKSDGARFAIYLFTDGGGDKWKDLSGGTNDLYYATTEGYEKCIFCRMNGGTTENNWSNKWNQSQDVTINGNEPFNYYVSTDDNWNNVAYMTR